MNLRPYRPIPPDINLTPLLDVVFLLLIFFMVSTTFKDESRLRVQLPQAQGEDVPTKEPERILVQIDRSGAFFVDEQAVVDRDPRTLVRALNGALGGRNPLPVLIQADAQTPHQAVMTAMDAAAELGLTRIAFGATRAGSETPEAVGGAGTDPATGAPGASPERPAPPAIPADSPVDRQRIPIPRRSESASETASEPNARP